jgi:hypothetical protein
VPVPRRPKRSRPCWSPTRARRTTSRDLA